MKVLVVHAHPDPESYGAAIRDAALAGLEAGRHDVCLIDLGAEDYQPCLTAAEHDGYPLIGRSGGIHHPDPVVRSHIAAVREAEALVFVYPTFWSGLPAILDGWIERSLLPGVVDHLGLVMGISTYGSPRSYRLVVGDGGKRILRMIRRTAGRRCRFRWLALDTLDGRADHERAAFLRDVETEMAALS